jgi:ketosteroid isomerase-like protein
MISDRIRQAAGSDDDRRQLEDIQQQLSKAWSTRDLATIDRLLAPDWSVTHIDGAVLTRAEVLRDFETGDNRLIESDIDELRVRVYEGFAIVTGRTHARGEYKGQQYDVTLRFTDVFVRRDQQWQAVASHASRITGGGFPRNSGSPVSGSQGSRPR